MTKLKKKKKKILDKKLKGRKFYIFISETPAEGLCFSTVHGIDEQFTKWRKEFSLNCFLSFYLLQILKRWQATGSAHFSFSEMPRRHAVQNSGPQPFRHQGPVLRKTIFPQTLGGVRAGGMVSGWFKHIVYCAFYFYYISSTSDHQALDPEGQGPLKVRSTRIKDFVSGSTGFACCTTGHI